MTRKNAGALEAKSTAHEIINKKKLLEDKCGAVGNSVIQDALGKVLGPILAPKKKTVAWLSRRFLACRKRVKRVISETWVGFLWINSKT
jgi:hypothetical protein